MKKQILDTLQNVYGVGVTVAPPEAVLWAAERCDDPRKALKAANAIRIRHGVVPAYAPYGHPAF